MLDKSPYIIDEFKGLWNRSDNFFQTVQRYEEIPDGYNFECHNVIFSNHGVQNRPAWVHSVGPYTPDIARFLPAYEGYVIWDPTLRDVYYNNTLLIGTYNVTIANADEFDIQILNLPGYTSGASTLPYKYLLGGGPLKVIDLATPAQRNACGAPPATAPTAATGAAGRVEVGLHLIAVVFETDTGFITKWGPAAQYTSPGAVQVNLTAIPTGPAGTAKRHIVATKVVRNFNGDTNAFEYFFVPGGTIGDNVTTTLTVNFYDTELVSSADYLLDISSTFEGRILGTFGNRAVYATDALFYYTSGVVVSEVAQFETINLVDNVLNIKGAITAFEYNGILYVMTIYGTYGFRDNGGPANTWERFFVDNSVIGLGTHCVARSPNGAPAIVDGHILVLGRRGLFTFNGQFQEHLSYAVDGLYRRYIENAIDRTKINIQINTSRRCFIITGFRSTGSPDNGKHFLYGDFTSNLTADSIKWSRWSVPFTIFTCMPEIGPVTTFTVGAGKNIYVVSTVSVGTNQDEDKTSGSIVKTNISGSVASNLLRAGNDYPIVNLNEIRACIRVDSNSPSAQGAFSVGLQLANVLRTNSEIFANGGVALFNIIAQFQRDFFVWSFTTASYTGGYRALELLYVALYFSIQGQSQIKK